MASSQRFASPLCLGLVTLLGASAALPGCGYTKEEYQAQADKLARADSKRRVAEQRGDRFGKRLH